MITVVNKKKPIHGGKSWLYELSGESTDNKPSILDGNTVGVNSLFLELDTGDFYYYDGENWNKIGSGGSSPSGDGYEITNPVLTLNISGISTNIEGVNYVDENGYLTTGTIFDAYGETKVVAIGEDGLYEEIIPKTNSYSNEVNCTVETGNDSLVITITDPTQDASIDVEYGLS